MSASLDWTTFEPVTPYRKTNGFFDLPVFSVACTWKGASEIVVQFGYSVSRSFILHRRPTKPASVNYGLCIRHRVGATVTRYKLWEDDGFRLNAPLYDRCVIKPNFCLEVWNLSGLSTASQATAIRMTTSLQVQPASTPTTPADYEAGAASQASSLSSDLNIPLAVGDASQWLDNS